MYEEFYESEFGKYALKKEAEYVANEIKDAKDILSIGCGTGIIEKEIERIANVEIICIEKEKEMLERARKNIIAIEGNAENLPFHNERFDAIIFITSLEFINDYKKAIKEGARVLRKKGIFIALMLNTNSKYFEGRYKKGGYITKNIRHIDIKKIEKYAKKFFDLSHEYFLCIDMKEECKNKEKVIYAIKGTKLLYGNKL